MKSWTLEKPKKFELKIEESGLVETKDKAKIKLESSIISATDIDLFNGTGHNTSYPIVPGRRGAGVISEIFEDNDYCFEKGNRVVIDPFLPCGGCLFCKTNRANLCINGKLLGIDIDGLFTNFATLKCNMLHKIPEQMPYSTAVFTEFVAMGLSIIDKINLVDGEHVAIFSANKLGFILAQLVTYYQGIAIVIDKNDDQLAKLSKENISYVLNPKKTKLKEAIKEITGGRFCEKVVYISNNSASLNDAIDACSQSGTLCLAGSAPLSSDGNFSEIHRKQININVCTNGHKNFPSALNLLATKTINVAPISNETISFDDIPQAFEKLDGEQAKYCSNEILID